MKKMISILLMSFIVLASCNSKAHNEAMEKDNYEKAKESLEEKEKKNPVSFLSVSHKYKRNLFGKTVIKATVSNNAKVCSYEDVQLELSFYSKTGTLLEKDNETVYELIYPGQAGDFKTKYFAPKGTDSLSIQILSAKVAE